MDINDFMSLPFTDNVEELIDRASILENTHLASFNIFAYNIAREDIPYNVKAELYSKLCEMHDELGQIIDSLDFPHANFK